MGLVWAGFQEKLAHSIVGTLGQNPVGMALEPAVEPFGREERPPFTSHRFRRHFWPLVRLGTIGTKVIADSFADGVMLLSTVPLHSRTGRQVVT